MKRVLHVLAVLVAGVVVALVILALTVRENSYTNTFGVTAPVDESWVTFTDSTRWVDWLPGDRVEFVADRHYRVLSDNGGWFEMQITGVTEYERWTANTWSFGFGRRPFATGDTELSFSAYNNGTRIVQTTTQNGVGFLWRAWVPEMKPLMQRAERGALEDLGYLIENEPTDVPVPPAPAPIPEYEASADTTVEDAMPAEAEAEDAELEAPSEDSVQVADPDTAAVPADTLEILVP